jgi:hypothetical protein
MAFREVLNLVDSDKNATATIAGSFCNRDEEIRQVTPEVPGVRLADQRLRVDLIIVPSGSWRVKQRMRESRASAGSSAEPGGTSSPRNGRSRTARSRQRDGAAAAPGRSARSVVSLSVVMSKTI